MGADSGGLGPVTASRVRHVGIPVSSLARAEAFYEGVLGFRAVADFPECGGSYYETLTGVAGARIHIKYLELAGGDRIELLEYQSLREIPGPAAADEVGRWHVSLTVTDLQALYASAHAAGFGFVSAPVRSPEGAVEVCYCRDPDGNLVELVQDLRPSPR